MLNKQTKRPSANMSRKAPAQPGKARAAQLPRGTASAKSSFFLNTQASTASLNTSNKRGGFLASHGNAGNNQLDHSSGAFKT